MNLTLTPEQQLIRDTARDFALRELEPHAEEWDQGHIFPREVFNKMAQLGFAGMLVPEEYGGAEAGVLTYILMLEEINRVLPAIGTVVSVHNSLVCGALLAYGTPEQKEYYLPKLTSGEWLGAYALSEAHAGSDPAAMRTTAERRGDVYIVNGTKTWITSGKSCELAILFAVTGNGPKPSRNISAFICPKGIPGLTVGKLENKMGIRASETTQLIYQDAELPADCLLGQEGEGFKIAMSLLDGGRLGIAAQAIGIAQRTYDEALSYSAQREQFGGPIADKQAIQFMLADMATGLSAARLLLYRAATMKDKGQRVSKEASMAKLFASELAMKSAWAAVQIHGGYGYVKEYPVERFFRDAKITEIYEGTSQIQRIVIAANLLKG
ncbi:MAG TPA: acyl-CoA dehydrogenase family protein [Chloroflexia bacterium]|nr:acyl-CoA dehydrogenase family protein [Chloroflexia bacterium]